MTHPPFKVCSCSISYTELEWKALPFVGVQESEDDTGKYSTELRNCSCRSTIGIETKVDLSEHKITYLKQGGSHEQ